MKEQYISIEAQIAEHNRKRIKPIEFVQLLVPIAALALALWLDITLPNVVDVEATQYYPALLKICIVIYSIFVILSCFMKKIREKTLFLSWYIAMLVFLIALYDYGTAKTGNLHSVLTVAPENIIATYPSFWSTLLDNTLGSLELLAEGLIWGIISGVLSGIIMGYSYWGNYWIGAILKIIGPVPAAAWLPIAITLMPSGHAASVLIICLAVWFPLTLNLSAGIKNVNRGYIEAAKCLGASKWQILVKVAIPAALPNFFTGMFMGLSSSFGALVFAEMLGVESGLGWYLMAAKNNFAFAKVLAAVIIFIVIFSLLTYAMFKIRDYFLRWQKGVIHW